MDHALRTQLPRFPVSKRLTFDLLGFLAAVEVHTAAAEYPAGRLAPESELGRSADVQRARHVVWLRVLDMS